MVAIVYERQRGQWRNLCGQGRRILRLGDVRHRKPAGDAMSGQIKGDRGITLLSEQSDHLGPAPPPMPGAMNEHKGWLCSGATGVATAACCQPRTGHAG